jgi:hypothetical protein
VLQFWFSTRFGTGALAELAERGLGVAILPSSVSRTRPMNPATSVLVQMARRLLRVSGGE